MSTYLKSALTPGTQRRTWTRPLLPGSRQGSTTVMEVLPGSTQGLGSTEKGPVWTVKEPSSNNDLSLKAEEEAAKSNEGGQRVEAGPWHLQRHEASSSLLPSFLDHHIVLYKRKRINKQVNEQKVEGIQAYILHKKHLVISAPNGTAQDSDFQFHHHIIGKRQQFCPLIHGGGLWSHIQFPSLQRLGTIPLICPFNNIPWSSTTLQTHGGITDVKSQTWWYPLHTSTHLCRSPRSQQEPRITWVGVRLLEPSQ